MSETILDESGSLKKKKKTKKRKLFFSTSSKKVKCEICSAVLKSKGILNSHMRIHSDHKEFRCEICSKEFRRKEQLKEHLPTHFRGYGLTNADFASTPLNALSLQYKPIVKTKDFRCATCSKVVPNGYHLRNHMASHSNFRPYCCQICQKAYKTRDLLRNHFIHCHPDCRQDYMEYVYIDEMNIMNGSEEKKYHCDVCMKGFNHKDSVKLHLFAHFDLKKFECKICSKRFPNSSQLRKHLRKHLTPATQLTICKEELQIDEDDNNEHTTRATELVTICKEELQIDEQGLTTMFNIRQSNVVIRRI
ncbi:zinc finger protein 236-like isoform X2 [Bradysia coprophila]|uniref:zinc finger protein 236-like isoform X2 n=1 Tax=Bradysia coprophila TaxID=38358 RepID=UPI00187D9CD6|nr:zinc finger protein 236-like isoform X2 [Bradysia coprophila]